MSKKTSKKAKRQQGTSASKAMLYRCPPIVWVVEMLVGFKGTKGAWREGWAPTTCANFEFVLAKEEKRILGIKNPDDKFRLKKYAAV